MLFTDKASGNLFILMSARINKRKLYLCKKQVNDSYFKGIDETEDYTTVETLER